MNTVNPEVDFDVVISGAGITGLVFAALVRQQGLSVALIEASEPANTNSDDNKLDPRALAITLASHRLLNAIDVWDEIPEKEIGHFRTMEVWDESGQGRVHFDSASICQPTMGYIVASSVLHKALIHKVIGQNAIECIQPVEIATIEPHQKHISIQLNNQKTLKASLLVAADGARSRVRELSGIGMTIEDCHQTAIAAIVKTEKAHDDCARQRFLREGPLAFLPLVDKNTCGIVWSTLPENARHLLDMEAAQFNRVLAQNFDHTLGLVLQSQQRMAFPLRQAQSSEYCRSRLALIGDAAHSVHPMAGQGANLGLLDAAVLAELVGKARQKNRDIGHLSVLRRYERWRKGENALMIQVLSGLKQLFENDSDILARVRNFGMNRFNDIDVLKEAIMRRTMGLSGDLPELLR